MNVKRTCTSCGTELPADAPSGLCVPCLLKNALPADQTTESDNSSKSTIVISPDIPASEKPGDHIGRYKLLQEIGEGGMGTVWMAQQDEPVRRRVALKVIKLGMDTKQVIGRFEIERGALALMDHPNIAKVFDGGMTNNGRPYFVMELVKGVPITKYCDDKKLNTRQRLELFIPVCRAIQHAHQKGIIHRDISPSNVLVTNHDGRPVPMVIDFGIAKATDQKLTDKTVFTAFGQFIGKPAYMSPEQAELNQMDVDTRTDIYALGVLLYELLTGKTPLDAKDLVSAGFEGMRKMIQEKEPPRPSTRISSLSNVEQSTVASQRQSEPPKLIHLVRGDLDWVTMKCLEKDRSRRYETANGLAADIERHLNNEPVVARPPSNLYRFQKLVRRNKLAFAAASAVATAILIGLCVSSWLYVNERSARQRAEDAEQVAEKAKQNEAELRLQAEANEKKAKAETAKSQHVSQFLRDMLTGVDPSVALGRDTTVLKEILDRTADRVGRDLIGEPEVEADIRATIGEVYQALAEYAKAETMHREALAIRRKTLGQEHADVASSLDDLAYALNGKGQFVEAEVFYRESLAMRRKLYGKDHEDIAASMDHLGLNLGAQGKSDECELMHRESLAMRRRLFGNEHLEVASSLSHLGLLMHGKGKLDEAEDAYREALSIRRKLLGNEHPRVASSLDKVANVLTRKGKLTESVALQRQALAMRRKLFNNDHPDVAWSLANLARPLESMGKLDEAETLTREALAMRRKWLGDNHQDVIFTINQLARILNSNGKFSEALELFRGLAEKDIPSAQTWIAWMYENGKGVDKDLNEAIRWYQKAAKGGDSYAKDRLQALQKD